MVDVGVPHLLPPSALITPAWSVALMSALRTLGSVSVFELISRNRVYGEVVVRVRDDWAALISEYFSDGMFAGVNAVLSGPESAIRRSVIVSVSATNSNLTVFGYAARSVGLS